MSKPEDVSHEAWNAAKEALFVSDPIPSYMEAVMTSVSLAIMAAKAEEREAIAQLAEATADHYDAKSIADAIEDVPANRAAEKALKGFASAIRNPTHSSNMGER
jgi:hypothetical protein